MAEVPVESAQVGAQASRTHERPKIPLGISRISVVNPHARSGARMRINDEPSLAQVFLYERLLSGDTKRIHPVMAEVPVESAQVGAQASRAHERPKILKVTTWYLTYICS